MEEENKSSKLEWIVNSQVLFQANEGNKGVATRQPRKIAQTFKNFDDIFKFLSLLNSDIKKFESPSSTPSYHLNFDDYFNFLQMLAQNAQLLPFFFQISKITTSVLLFFPLFLFDFSSADFPLFLNLLGDFSLQNNVNINFNDKNDNNNNNNEDDQEKDAIKKDIIIKFLESLKSDDFEAQNAYYYLQYIIQNIDNNDDNNNNNNNLKLEIQQKIFLIFANLSISPNFFPHFLANSKSDFLHRFLYSFFLFVLKYSPQFPFFSDLLQIFINLSSFEECAKWMIEENLTKEIFKISEEQILQLHFSITNPEKNENSKIFLENLLQISKIFNNLTVDKPNRSLLFTDFPEMSLMDTLRDGDRELVIEGEKKSFQLPVFLNFLINVKHFLIPRLLAKTDDPKLLTLQSQILLRCYRIYKNTFEQYPMEVMDAEFKDFARNLSIINEYFPIFFK